MKLLPHSPAKALSKAYLRQSLRRDQIDLFKSGLARMFERIRTDESEEHLKNIVADFLKDTWYKQTNEINTKDRKDLVIHNGKFSTDAVAVIIEAKKPSNKTEMISAERPNAKAFHELILYYLRETMDSGNHDIKHLTITNIHEWFVFDGVWFEKNIFRNAKLIKEYQAWKVSGHDTRHFYERMAQRCLDGLEDDIPCTYFDFRDVEKILRKPERADDRKLIDLYKVLSPQHLLKQSFANDANSLNREFYNELLHIVGLEEVKDKGKKLISRKAPDRRNEGSLLENAINMLKIQRVLDELDNPEQFGGNADERLFSIGLELCIIWLNRILFLKLLEGQLIAYHRGDRGYAFLKSDKITDFDDLQELFFEVLARRLDERSPSVAAKFGAIPYLNSSLFEISDLERKTIQVYNLKGRLEMPVHGATVLKDASGKRISGNRNTLGYLFDFLDAYDFANEGKADIQETAKTIINASVLGLIFEKINGYRDGSFYTPGFITMYMSREAIRRAVVQKFRDAKLPGCQNPADFDDLGDKLDYTDKELRHKANEVINSLRICDPAVGSGHFLVSALNEIIAVKSDLRILTDRDGKRLHGCVVTIENDELIVTIEDELFVYNPKDPESRRIQEALFHEKQAIIEQCLFGVDINPKSVSICRLRLWIELLKSAYYTRESGYAELETLPNIDINIKCGNSLVSRFAITGVANVYATERYKLKAITDSYKEKVWQYKQTPANKHILRKEIADLKEALQGFAVPTDPDLIALRKIKNNLDQLGLGMVSEELEEFRALVVQEEELKRVIRDKHNTVYANAFEWHFEFPEVLDEDGNFIGFDIVIMNPPYGIKFNKEEKEFLKNEYNRVHIRTPESFNYFIDRAYDISSAKGRCGVIVPSSLLNQIEFEKTRKFLLDNCSIEVILNLGDEVFQDVNTPTCIVEFTKNKYAGKIKYADLTLVDRDLLPNTINSVSSFIECDSFKYSEGHSFNYKKFKSIIEKCYNNPNLKVVTEEVATGISSGFDKAYVFTDSQIKENNLEPILLKKLIIGGEINRYNLTPKSNKQIIYITSNESIKEYPAVEKELLQYKDVLLKRREAANGKIEWFSLNWPRRKKLFENPKILIRQTANCIIASYDDEKWYCLKSGIIIQLPDRSDIHYYYLLAILNSRLIDFLYRDLVNEDNRIFPEVKPIQLFKLPVKVIDKPKQTPIITLVEQILAAKKADAKADTSALETQIDCLVYQLYGLTDEEITVVEGKNQKGEK